MAASAGAAATTTVTHLVAVPRNKEILNGNTTTDIFGAHTHTHTETKVFREILF